LLDDHCHKIPIDPFYEQQHDVMGHRGYKKCIQAVIRKHEGSRTLGRCKHEDNIRMDLEETWCEQNLT
jgi:hypothetical protein